MSDNPLKQLRAQIESTARKKAASKANHTLYLSEPQYSRFRDYCKQKDVKPSEVVDQLIAMWLAEVATDDKAS